MLALQSWSVAGVFLLFSPLWWLLTVAASTVIILSLSFEKGKITTFILFASALLMVFLGDLQPINWFSENPTTAILTVVGYVLLGGLWGVFHWYHFVKERYNKYQDAKVAWLRSKGANELTESLKEEWEKYLLDSYDWSYSFNRTELDQSGHSVYVSKRALKIIPYAWEYKSTIILWMSYWPWSAFWWLMEDFIINIFRSLQRRLSNLMDRVSKWVFQNLESDLKTKDSIEKDRIYNRNG